jgi:hypothetical protein
MASLTEIYFPLLVRSVDRPIVLILYTHRIIFGVDRQEWNPDRQQRIYGRSVTIVCPFRWITPGRTLYNPMKKLFSSLSPLASDVGVLLSRKEGIPVELMDIFNLLHGFYIQT